MYAIVGAAGKVGHATASALRRSGARVRAILRDESTAAKLAEIGCEIVVADLQDPDALAKAIAGADAVQIVAPLSRRAADPVDDLRRSMASLVMAVERARLPRVLAISDYGAHVARDIGMPSIFRDFETRLARIGGHKLVLRSAEHMENRARLIPAAIESGRLPIFQDSTDRLIPTISAPDLGRIAAGLLLRTGGKTALEIHHAEGPRRYSARDVAKVLGELAGRTIQAEPVPRAHWDAIMKRSMPVSLAELLIKTSEAMNQGGVVDVEENVGEVRHGTTELIDAMRPLMPRQ